MAFYESFHLATGAVESIVTDKAANGMFFVSTFYHNGTVHHCLFDDADEYVEFRDSILNDYNIETVCDGLFDNDEGEF